MPLFETGRTSQKAPAAGAEDVANSAFGVDTFIANLETLANAAGGTASLRRLILDLAIHGRLTSPTSLAGAGDGPFPIPNHWAWGRGADVFAFVTSGSRGWAAYYAADGPIFLRIGNLDYETTDLDLRNVQHVRPPQNAEGVRTRVEVGDVLISITGDTGMVGLAPPNLGEAYINQHIALARPSAKAWPAFVARALTAPSLLGRLQSAQRGIKNSLGLGDVRGLAVPLPPLAEQKRIVARVDQLMALIDDLEAKQTKKRNLSTRFTKASLEALTTAESPEDFDTAWKRLLENWDTLFPSWDSISAARKSIVDLAIRGRLVRGTSLVAKPAAAPEQALPARDIPFTAPASWKWVQLGSVSQLINGDRGKNYPNKDEYVERGIPFINTGHIRPNATLSSDSMHYLTREKFDSLRSGKVQRGDLVYCLRGATLGKTAIIHDYDEGAIASSLVIIRLAPGLIPKFAYYFLVSDVGRGLIRRFDNGSAQPNLAANSVKSYVVPVPPLSEQHAIVAKVEHLMKLCDDLEAQLRRAEDRASKLVEAVVQEMVA